MTDPRHMHRNGRPSHAVREPDWPSVAVVIPVRNYPAVKRCLETVAVQNYPRFEVIVVDDGSTDNTAEIVRGFPSVRLLRKEQGGAASARNYGAEHAASDVLFFLDSDTQIEPDCLRLMVKPFLERRDVGMTHGLYGIANPESLIAWLIFLKCDYHFRELTEMDFAWSFAIAVRRDVYDKIGHFDAQFQGAGSEDIDFAYRLRDAGYGILLVRQAIVRHSFHDKLGKHLRRHLAQARLRMMLIRKTSRLTDQQIRPREYFKVIFHALSLASLPLLAWGSVWPILLAMAALSFHLPLTFWAIKKTGDPKCYLFIPFEWITVCMWVFGSAQGAWWWFRHITSAAAPVGTERLHRPEVTAAQPGDPPVNREDGL